MVCPNPLQCWVAACLAWVVAADFDPLPIIGIVAVPSTTNIGVDYIPKSYVDWVHAAGGRVMPLPSGVKWNKTLKDWTVDQSDVWTPKQYEDRFKLINGLLLPGGNPWPIVSSLRVRQLLDLARNANLQGGHFPVWGTCAGFETLMVLNSGDNCQARVLDGRVPDVTCTGPMTYGWNATNLSLPQTLTSDASKSRLLGSAGDDLVRAIETEPLAANFHRASLDPSTFETNSELVKAFRVLSKSVDSRGREFVSTIEGVDLPWYGTQWHPEKPAGEWGVKNGVPYEAINHSPDAIRLGQHMASVFVSEASRNSHQGQLDLVTPMLIINHVPGPYNPAHPIYMQIYTFDWKESISGNGSGAGNYFVV